MAVDRALIVETVFRHRLEYEFKNADVFLAADRADLTNGEALNEFLAAIDQKLSGLDPAKIHAAKNIVLELAGNVLLHGMKEVTTPELLLLICYQGVVKLFMFGHGRKSQIERLNQIIVDIRKMAEPPNHREQLLKRRNDEVLRRVSSQAPKETGGGAGMMTIAALSSEPLWFRPRYAGREASFALRSVI
jgi:hypothetical protein